MRYTFFNSTDAIYIEKSILSILNPKKTGVLLLNIGTPSEPTVKGLRTYLKEFLSDPDVIDVNPILRWIIVNLFVVPFRPRTVLPQYKSIWMEEGSPLLAYSTRFAAKISTKNPDVIFEIGMRYGSPSIEEGLIKLQKEGVDKIVLSPMFPQYAQATSGSCVRKAIEIIEARRIPIPYMINDYFYQEDFYIDSLAESIENNADYHESELLLFSFHGLPERQIKKMDESQEYCLRQNDCCATPSEYNTMCYKFHCHETTRKIMERVKTKKPFRLSFQSRFGFDPWIQPNTTDVIEKLPNQNIKKISVICPAFVFDCLETLEEIAIRNNEYFVDAGGDSLKLIPALNANTKWVDSFYTYLHRKFIQES